MAAAAKSDLQLVTLPASGSNKLPDSSRQPKRCCAGHGVSLGSYEYLVYEKVFVAVAAEFGLQPVTDYAPEGGQGFRAQYHEHRPLHDLLEQVSCSQLAICCCESLYATASKPPCSMRLCL